MTTPNNDSINEQGAIFIKARELVNYIRSTIIYNEKLNEFKDHINHVGGELAQNDILVYDFNEQDFVSGKVTSVNDIESNVITLAVVTIADNKWVVVEKEY